MHSLCFKDPESRHEVFLNFRCRFASQPQQAGPRKVSHQQKPSGAGKQRLPIPRTGGTWVCLSFSASSINMETLQETLARLVNGEN